MEHTSKHNEYIPTSLMPETDTLNSINELQQQLALQNIALKVERNARKRAVELNIGQSRLLEMIAEGALLKQTLTSLMLLIESQTSGVTCSTLLLDETGLLIKPGAAPNLPDEYTAKLDGLPIGPEVGSCGTAMYLKQQVIVTDMMTDPLWAPYKSLIEPYGFRACWSTPIFLNQDQVLGAFAMYYREVRSPDSHDMELIEFATHIAGIAIERTQRESELRLHREHLEELIAVRTAELTVAKQHTEAVNLSLSSTNTELAQALENLRLMQEELVRRDKLAALGSLVTGVAHELNTPIGNCLMIASSLADRTQQLASLYASGIKRSELENYVQDAVYSSDVLIRNLHRAADLVTSFKQVSVDQSSTQRREFYMEAFLDDVLLTLQPAFKQSAFTIHHKIQPGLLLDSYPGPLSQVVCNLVNNAMLHGFESRQSGHISLLAHEINAEWLELVITDNGNGIAMENQPMLFNPFFTTKRHLGYPGLGLHIAHNIVTDLLGGRIRFQSELGVGTTFYLALPLKAPPTIF